MSASPERETSLSCDYDDMLDEEKMCIRDRDKDVSRSGLALTNNASLI